MYLSVQCDSESSKIKQKLAEYTKKAEENDDQSEKLNLKASFHNSKSFNIKIYDSSYETLKAK